ncbi:MAG: polysaccharide deacetylase family protein [Candidatus Eremiobacteraeota bacterium]|uniref:NodB homology domain-containing protein n=1 Tax=mine drainage metagenome TaxID=410659 RepID=E6PIA9_9ZZZZ|nr:polysaccharide deacetylase family protein [Candidatus Eremiobacteraeota bacterium]
MRNLALFVVAIGVLLGSTPGGAPPGGMPPKKLTLTLVREPTVRVLMFHQISNDPIEPKTGVGTPWMAPQRFNDLLHALAQRGYHFITMQETLAFLSGKIPAARMPQRSVTLTFDDGYRSAWTEATPIFQRYHASATMFFEGHATGTIPGRLTDADLRAMARSGVWSLQSHGFAGHSDLVVGPHGDLSPYWYANLEWLSKEHRFETLAEFEERVQGDLLRFRHTFEPITGAPIDLFAYPSGEYGENAALPSGANPQTNTDAGHSNSPNLTPLIFRALKNDGFIAAFSVYDPGHVHFASRGDDLYALPRIGFTAKASVAQDLQFMNALETKGIEFPEIYGGHYTAVAPIAVSGAHIYAASTTQPLLYLLDRHGRRIAAYREIALDRGRAGAPAAIGALAIAKDKLWVVQQAALGARVTPFLNEFSIAGGAPKLVARRALPKALSWVVGIAWLDGKLYGIDDGGEIFDVQSGRQVGRIVRSNTYQSGRFAGLAAKDGELVTYDRKTHRIIFFIPQGAIRTVGALRGDVRSLAVEGDRLYVSRWDPARHMLRIYTMGASNKS